MTLRKFITALFITISYCLTIYGQPNQSIIKNIRKYFQEINTDTTLKTISLEDEEFLENTLDGGGELTGYFKKDSIVKIIEWIGLSYGNRTREYYFRKNKLFFVFEKFESFVLNKEGDGLDHSKVRTSFEGRYYFNNDTLIGKKTSGKRVFEDNSQDIVKELLTEAKDNMKLLIKKK